jgi:hypothetical protein
VVLLWIEMDAVFSLDKDGCHQGSWRSGIYCSDPGIAQVSCSVEEVECMVDRRCQAGGVQQECRSFGSGPGCDDEDAEPEPEPRS